MKNLHIVMPMAGLGSRFLNSKYSSSPKPFIHVDNKPMFLKALDSFDNIQVSKKFTFIIRREDNTKYHLKEKIIDLLPDAHVIVLSKDTRGAADTVYKAQRFFSPSEPVILMDCDLYFKSNQLNELIALLLKGEYKHYGGALVYFKSDNNRYSFAKINNNEVIATAEKVAISHNAIAGAYLFASSEILKEILRTYLNKPLPDNMKEYYISQLYNLLIGKGYKVKACKADQYYSFGTPEELSNYEKTK